MLLCAVLSALSVVVGAGVFGLDALDGIVALVVDTCVAGCNVDEVPVVNGDKVVEKVEGGVEGKDEEIEAVEVRGPELDPELCVLDIIDVGNDVKFGEEAGLGDPCVKIAVELVPLSEAEVGVVTEAARIEDDDAF